MQLKRLGKSATGERLQRMKQSPHYKNGQFHNLSHTPSLTEGYGFWGVLYEFLFKKSPRRTPVGMIPSLKADLLNVPPDKDVLVWFGHSSYFMRVDGKNILVDPVFSGSASPIPGLNKAFKGTDRYTVSDVPLIDYLFLTHDHYDHADYETLVQLQSKVKNVFCGLGVGAHLEHWGYDPKCIIEKDWHESTELGQGFTVDTTPARHFSGRGFRRNSTLWLSYVLRTPTMKIFIGGDGGYDTHFAEIGKKYGPFDLVILENGQYNIKWKYIHLLPEQVVQAADDLRAKRLFPVHSSKFMMANHAWDEPLRRVVEYGRAASMPVITPMIGELVDLKDSNQKFNEWWVGIE